MATRPKKFAALITPQSAKERPCQPCCVSTHSTLCNARTVWSSAFRKNDIGSFSVPTTTGCFRQRAISSLLPHKLAAAAIRQRTIVSRQGEHREDFKRGILPSPKHLSRPARE